MKRVAIFVDVQNIYYTTRQAFGRQFNYRSFWQKVSEQYQIEFATAYAIDSNNDGQIKFQSALKHIGFEVKLKPFIQRSDGSAKGDWDVGITIDVMEQAGEVDHIMLLSGDGDFDLLLQKVAERDGVTTEVVGVESLSADSLKRSASIFTAISLDKLL